MTWYVVFLLIVAAIFYLVNWVIFIPGSAVVKLPVIGYTNAAQLIIDTFLILVFILGFLQMLGVGRGRGF